MCTIISYFGFKLGDLTSDSGQTLCLGNLLLSNVGIIYVLNYKLAGTVNKAKSYILNLVDHQRSHIQSWRQAATSSGLWPFTLQTLSVHLELRHLCYLPSVEASARMQTIPQRLVQTRSHSKAHQVIYSNYTAKHLVVGLPLPNPPLVIARAKYHDIVCNVCQSSDL